VDPIEVGGCEKNSAEKIDHYAEPKAFRVFVAVGWTSARGDRSGERSSDGQGQKEKPTKQQIIGCAEDRIDHLIPCGVQLMCTAPAKAD
jgi:hypothetical protein